MVAREPRWPPPARHSGAGVALDLIPNSTRVRLVRLNASHSATVIASAGGMRIRNFASGEASARIR